MKPHPHLACSQRPLRSAKYTILVIYLIIFFGLSSACTVACTIVQQYHYIFLYVYNFFYC